VEIKTKRDAQIARAAFENGCQTVAKTLEDNGAKEAGRAAWDVFSYRDKAYEVYPDPVRPREIVMNDFRYRCVNGKLQYYSEIMERWTSSSQTTCEIMTLVDLIQNPTEPILEGEDNG